MAASDGLSIHPLSFGSLKKKKEKEKFLPGLPLRFSFVNHARLLLLDVFFPLCVAVGRHLCFKKIKSATNNTFFRSVREKRRCRKKQLSLSIFLFFQSSLPYDNKSALWEKLLRVTVSLTCTDELEKVTEKYGTSPLNLGSRGSYISLISPKLSCKSTTARHRRPLENQPATSMKPEWWNFTFLEAHGDQSHRPRCADLIG